MITAIVNHLHQRIQHLPVDIYSIVPASSLEEKSDCRFDGADGKNQKLLHFRQTSLALLRLGG
jgi:hypothetical protein